jgi:hypothetical protein
MSLNCKHTNKCGKIVSTTKCNGIKTRSFSKYLEDKKLTQTRSINLRSRKKNINLHQYKINNILSKFCKTFNQAPNDEPKRQIKNQDFLQLDEVLSQKCEFFKNEPDYYEINHELLNTLNQYLEENIKLPKFYDTIHSYYLVNKIIKTVFPKIKNIPTTDRVWDLRLIVLKKMYEFEHSTTKENFKNFY